MANDLAVGIFAIFGLSVLAYVGGRSIRLGRSSFGFGVALLSSLLFAWTFAGNLVWAAIVPGSSVVIWSNLMPMLLCFAAGMAGEAPALARVSRPIAVSALLVLAVAYALTPYTRPLFAPVEVGSKMQWCGDVCLQTHSSTCAPAAAVTLLQLDGIEASEREMVTSCLTSSHGTEPLGLYRGLAMAVHDSAFRARVAVSNPDQWARRDQLPNIALVRLADSSQRGSSRWLLGPQGEGHAIVVLGRDLQGNWLIADPAFGKTKWSNEQFRSRFTGDAIYLSN